MASVGSPAVTTRPGPVPGGWAARRGSGRSGAARNLAPGRGPVRAARPGVGSPRPGVGAAPRSWLPRGGGGAPASRRLVRQRLVGRQLGPVVHVRQVVPLGGRPVAVGVALGAALPGPDGRQRLLAALRPVLAAPVLAVSRP